MQKIIIVCVLCFFVSFANCAVLGSGKRAMAAIHTSCVQPNVVALTFDDGPYKWHTNLTDVLGQHNAKATFFVNGNNWDCIYDPEYAGPLVDSYNAGHQIASHTWSHADLTSVSSTQFSSELTKIDASLKKILGVKAAFLRPPYGAYNDNVRLRASDNEQELINWDFDSGDADGNSAESSIELYDRVLQKKPSSLLALNHETHEDTVNVVIPHVLATWSAAGYKFVTVAECLGASAYISTGPASTRDASWDCE